MSMMREFRDFAMRGNVVDMAVGVIIGAAFGKIVSSLVSDVLMPPIGKVMGNVDFRDLFVDLSGGSHPSLDAAKAAGAATINYGLFINTVIDFVIVAFVIFLLVRTMNRMKKKEEPAAAPTTRPCPQCLMEIPLQAKRCGHCTSEVRAA
jgi:large conductance mechanosensitive channel